MRFFNTAGPNQPDIHYTLSPLSRWNLDEMLSLIEQRKYFVLHAPRQTGKTSCLLALMKYLNDSGQYTALYANVEAAQAAREDVAGAMRAILSDIGERARIYLKDSFVSDSLRTAFDEAGANGALRATLTGWAESLDRPLILMLDEVDSLIGDTLISLLRQLRSGYDKRPENFPQTVILCGVRDVRDYRIHSAAEKTIITGGSAFNIKAESLRLADFSREDIAALYAQHTEETGQEFEREVFPRVWDLTEGQPWLVNALAYEACFRMKENRDRSRSITAAIMDAASENLILRRDTHLDQLADKLQEPRVRRVIEPLLAGDTDISEFAPDDVSYVRDLGLIRADPSVRIANGMYREVIPRELTYERGLMMAQETAWYLRGDGSLDTQKLLRAFQEFFREHSEHWVERFAYKEAGPQLLLQAFLQRVVNGGGRIQREYGLGRGRTDLLVEWERQRVVLELKILRRSLEWTVKQGLEQTAAYMDRCGSQEGHLIIFDRDSEKPWEEKVWVREERAGDRTITVWGM